MDQDKEDFSVGASIPKAMGSGGGNVVVHLYVWDRKDHREIRLRAPSSIGSAVATRKALETLRQAYQAADPRLEVHGT
ncbi:hypothetical protein [Streptomyces collinus]|uniref:hypothetical protein n=1 Tax=Streptomyces collinus TaxID=42684 RepID=UPI00332A2ED9